MLCPMTFGCEQVKECFVDCPWACVTAQGFGCAIGFFAIKGEADNIGINLEPLPDYLLDMMEENKDEVSEM